MRSEGSKRLTALDMTQRQIATRIGVSRATVAMWASGQRVPDEDHRKALFAAIGFPVHAWPDEWALVRDVIIAKLVAKAPDLLVEIVEDLKRLGVTLE